MEPFAAAVFAQQRDPGRPRPAQPDGECCPAGGGHDRGRAGSSVSRARLSLKSACVSSRQAHRCQQGPFGVGADLVVAAVDVPPDRIDARQFRQAGPVRRRCHAGPSPVATMVHYQPAVCARACRHPASIRLFAETTVTDRDRDRDSRRRPAARCPEHAATSMSRHAAPAERSSIGLRRPAWNTNAARTSAGEQHGDQRAVGAPVPVGAGQTSARRSPSQVTSGTTSRPPAVPRKAWPSNSGASCRRSAISAAVKSISA